MPNAAVAGNTQQPIGDLVTQYLQLASDVATGEQATTTPSGMSKRYAALRSMERSLIARKEECTDLLIDQMETMNEQTGKFIGETLSKFGSDIVPPLLKRIGRNRLKPDINREFESSAFYAIQELGPEANSALQLILADSNSDAQLKMDTIDVIQTMPERHNLLTSEIVASLLSALSDQNPGVRLRAVRALSAVGPRNPKVVQAVLTQSQKELDPAVRLEYARALGRFAQKESPRAQAETMFILQKMLNTDKGIEVRTAAAEALRLDDAPVSSVSSLRDGLRDKSEVVRIASLRSLHYRGPMARLLIPEIRRLINSSRPLSLEQANLIIGVMNSMGTGAEPLLPTFVQATSPETAKNLDYQALCALCTYLKGKASPAVPLLVDMLGSEYARLSVIQTLGAIGPNARDALPTLRSLSASDKGSTVECNLAIGRISGAAKPPEPRPSQPGLGGI